MTDKELRRLRREDLLQLLIGQQKQIEDLTAALESAEAALADRKLRMEKAGSIAEAALQLNGVFEAAQKAADEYLAGSKRRADAMLAEAQQKLDASGAAQAPDRADAAASEAPEAAQRGLFGRGRRQ